ncbi:MAG: class I SAM-dependent methyltransferase [Bryobacterales bacterium]|nr:class I SAM-dependent methyltransferase [Bryobacterales bacterium]
MATIAENLTVWNTTYAWPSGGDEWSAAFGGTEALWYFVLYPRIHRFVPAPTILEIAPGFGRWTQFLKTQCESMIAVDISEKCVEHCRMRFASERHLKFYVNDGISLSSIPDNSVDFVFSFDSLVHAEKEVIAAYLVQLERKLSPDGVGFIHHSNIGAYGGRLTLLDGYLKLPSKIRQAFLTRDAVSRLLSINLQAGRARSMTAALFREYCLTAGLKCIRQELINWTKGRALIDALSVFARPHSRWDTNPTCVNNHAFVKNARITSRLARVYCS